MQFSSSGYISPNHYVKYDQFRTGCPPVFSRAFSEVFGFFGSDESECAWQALEQIVLSYRIIR